MVVRVTYQAKRATPASGSKILLKPIVIPGHLHSRAEDDVGRPPSADPQRHVNQSNRCLTAKTNKFWIIAVGEFPRERQVAFEDAHILVRRRITESHSLKHICRRSELHSETESGEMLSEPEEPSPSSCQPACIAANFSQAR
jgi:hypothetical protein